MACGIEAQKSILYVQFGKNLQEVADSNDHTDSSDLYSILY